MSETCHEKESLCWTFLSLWSLWVSLFRSQTAISQSWARESSRCWKPRPKSSATSRDKPSAKIDRLQRSTCAAEQGSLSLSSIIFWILFSLYCFLLIFSLVKKYLFSSHFTFSLYFLSFLFLVRPDPAEVLKAEQTAVLNSACPCGCDLWRHRARNGEMGLCTPQIVGFPDSFTLLTMTNK